MDKIFVNLTNKLEFLRTELEFTNKNRFYNLDEEQISKLLNYLELLQKWNSVYNLTGIKKLEDMLTKHIFESLELLPYFPIYAKEFSHLNATRILDVGAGAGIPSIILAIIFKDYNFLALDANGKKTRFMLEASAKLDLKNFTVMQKRLPTKMLNTNFDIIISRAFASFADFLQLTQNLAHEKTIWLAMKTKVSQEELKYIPVNFVLLKKHALIKATQSSLYIFEHI